MKAYIVEKAKEFRHFGLIDYGRAAISISGTLWHSAVPSSPAEVKIFNAAMDRIVKESNKES